MMWCWLWHKWSPWSEPFGWLDSYYGEGPMQTRTCERCNQQKKRLAA